MIDRLELIWRRFRNFISRSEWAIRRFRLERRQESGAVPGLLLIQIDGLSHSEMKKAIEKGRLPFLQRLLESEDYHSRIFYSGLPSSTPAVQAELYYGVKGVVPGFAFLDRERGYEAHMYYPEAAQMIEAGLQKQGDGLLQEGVSYSNIYTGGAGESHFCAASLGYGDLLRVRPKIFTLVFFLLHFPVFFRWVGLVFMEIFLAGYDFLKNIVQGQNIRSELKVIPSRVGVCVGLREWIKISAKIDLALGVPIIHVNFLGYDEQAHFRGPGSVFAHWILRGIDRTIQELYEASLWSKYRDYRVWIFSDHGQESVVSYRQQHGTDIGTALCRSVEGLLVKSNAELSAWRSESRHSRIHWMGGNFFQAFCGIKSPKCMRQDLPFRTVASGSLAHVYVNHELSVKAKNALARRWIREAGVSVALFRTANSQIAWIDSSGEFLLPQDTTRVLPQSGNWANEVTEDLIRLVHHPHAGDLVLLGWSKNGQLTSFSAEKGTHSGPGLNETQGFILFPSGTLLPPGCDKRVRPYQLRKAALNLLGREPFPSFPRAISSESLLRVVTFNIHSCRGMDGRIAPERIVRILKEIDPDIVALQEVDLGRTRTGRQNQARIIADALGFQFYFHPTLIEGGGHYGHALLSRFPFELIRADLLRTSSDLRRREPRGALWVRIQNRRRIFHVFSTHLGLTARERREQISDLLGKNWMGGIVSSEPVLFCGDLNATPLSYVYREVSRLLQDVQMTHSSKPAKTFFSRYPIGRIDHIFVSRHFRVRRVRVPSGELYQITSDHLPVIADLAVEKP